MVFLGLALLFLVTALLTAAEMATFSARPERMRQAALNGDKRGTLVLAYQRSPVSFLSAGQVIATAAAFVTGAIIQAEFTPAVVGWLKSVFQWDQTSLDAVGGTSAFLFFTIVALILTNVVPKQIGFDHADRVALFFSNPFRLLIRLTRPIAWLVTVTSQVFEKMVNRRNRLGARVTEADLLTLLAEGIRIGALNQHEALFVRHALRLSDLCIRDVMTPIDKIEAIDALWSLDRIDEAIRKSDHSFLPVFDGSLDRPLGILRARQWLSVEGTKPKLEDLLLPLNVLETQDSAVELFQALKGRESRIVFVQEEGRTVGMVTLNDAVELLTGKLESLAA